MRIKKSLSRSAQVIAFLKSQALVDEQTVTAKKTSSAPTKKSKAKPAATKKRKAIKKKVAFQSHQVGFRKLGLGEPGIFGKPVEDQDLHFRLNYSSRAIVTKFLGQMSLQ